MDEASQSAEAHFEELDFQQANDLVRKRQRYQRRATQASELINHL